MSKGAHYLKVLKRHSLKQQLVDSYSRSHSVDNLHLGRKRAEDELQLIASKLMVQDGLIEFEGSNVLKVGGFAIKVSPRTADELRLAATSPLGVDEERDAGNGLKQVALGA